MDGRPPSPSHHRRMPDERWSEIMEYGYALWFVATLGVLGFLAGWHLDGATGRIGGRVAFTLLGVIFGAAIGATAIRSWRRRGRRT